MSESRDMDAPVTRRELHETLELWGGALAARLEGRFVGLERRMDGLEGRMDGLEGRMGGIEGRMDGIEGRMDGLEGRIVALFESFEARFMTELRAQVRGALEDVRAQVSAIDDKYNDLPARVGRLEAKVFPPRKPRRRRAS